MYMCVDSDVLQIHVCWPHTLSFIAMRASTLYDGVHSTYGQRLLRIYVMYNYLCVCIIYTHLLHIRFF